MRCQSAGQVGREQPAVERHSHLLDQCANFGLLDNLYTQLVLYTQLSPSDTMCGRSWSKKQQATILHGELRATFTSLQQYLQDALLPKLRMNEKKEETISQDHKARVVESEFYTALQGVLIEQMLNDSRVRAAVTAVCGLQQYEQLNEQQFLNVCEHVVAEVLGMFGRPMEPLGLRKQTHHPPDPSAASSSLHLPSLGAPHPPSSPLPDRLGAMSRCSTEDIYNTPRINSHRGAAPNPRQTRRAELTTQPNSARTPPAPRMPCEPPLSANTLAGRRQLMASQGSVVEDGLEFTELSSDRRECLTKLLASTTFDVTTLSETELCDVVKFCFHNLGVCSWYELSAAAVHSLVAEAASVHRQQDLNNPPPAGCSSWAHTVHWCHMLYHMLKVGGAARFLTYFDVFALLVAITQVGTLQRCCWLSGGLGSQAANGQARLRMKLSTLLTTLHHYVQGAVGVFASLTSTEISSMKRKLTNCFEACKRLCQGEPVHLSAEQQQQMATGMAKVPSNSNIAHDRALQRSSSRFRSTLMRLLFHGSAVAVGGVEQELALKAMDWRLEVAAVSKEQWPTYALQHMQQSSALFSGLRALGLSGVSPMLSNMQKLGALYSAKVRNGKQGHNVKQRARKHKKKAANELVLPPLVAR